MIFYAIFRLQIYAYVAAYIQENVPLNRLLDATGTQELQVHKD